MNQRKVTKDDKKIEEDLKEIQSQGKAD